MIEYKLKEGTKCTIIKTGHDIEFDFSDIEKDVTYLNKTKKEIEAQIGIHKATMKNVQYTHPHVAAMTQEDLTAAFLYRQATGYINEAEKKLKEIDQQLEDYAAEEVEITKQTGITKNTMSEETIEVEQTVAEQPVVEEAPVVVEEAVVEEAPVVVEEAVVEEAPAAEEPKEEVATE